MSQDFDPDTTLEGMPCDVNWSGPRHKVIPEYDALKELELEMKCNQSREIRPGKHSPRSTSPRLLLMGGEELLREELKTWELRYKNMRNRALKAERKVNNLQMGPPSQPRTKKQKNADHLLHVIERYVHLIERTINGVGAPHQHPNGLRFLVWDTYRIDTPEGSRIPCCHCGAHHKFDDFTIEHLKPKFIGGSNDISNLRGACAACNASRPCEDISHKFNPPTSQL